MNIENDLKAVISSLNEDWNNSELNIINDTTNLFALIDSFALLNVVIETESMIESNYGEYVPLADELIMDSGKSPFLTFSTWVEFVQFKLNQSGIK